MKLRGKGGKEESKEGRRGKFLLEELEARNGQLTFSVLVGPLPYNINIAFVPLVGDEVWGQRCRNGFKTMFCRKSCMHSYHMFPCFSGYSLSHLSSGTK